MTIKIAGGVYREYCEWPDWNQLYGSGGRAAAALGGANCPVELHFCGDQATEREMSAIADLYDFSLRSTPMTQRIAFRYVHPMSIPQIIPSLAKIVRGLALELSGDVILRFGMLESSAVVHGERCVYDPQSSSAPERFHANGSTAQELAIVANRAEALAMGGEADVLESARSALRSAGASVFVLKLGAQGVRVLTKEGDHHVPAYRSEGAFTIGSGDVFAAAFTACWGLRRMDPVVSARIASVAVSEYVSSRSLPMRAPEILAAERPVELSIREGKVYLASPFFTMAQRWLVDEARRCLTEVGLKVFSPFHEIGPGPAEIVAPADIDAIKSCDLVFAILDGLDSGTIFEVGYANALGKPVYGLSQNVSDEDLKMLQGSGCRLYADFATAVHHAAARL